MNTTTPETNLHEVPKTNGVNGTHKTSGISMPWLRKGDNYIREVEALSPTAPTILKVTCHSAESPDVTYISAIPVFKGSVNDAVEKFRDSMVSGEQEDTFEPDDEENVTGCVPDGNSKIWHVTTTRLGSVFFVSAHWFTAEGTVGTTTFRLGLTKIPHTRKMQRAIRSYLSKQENFQKFLQARRWLASQIELRSNIVWAETPVGNVASNALLLVRGFDTALALACLERNQFNRSVDTGHIGRLQIEIVQENFTRSSENICFDVQGHLIDGQHRVSSVILAGKPIPTSMAFGHAVEDIKNMNAGSKGRTFSDNFDIRQRTQIELGIIEEGDLDVRNLPLGKEFKQIAGKVIYLETDKYIYNTAAMQDAVLMEYYPGLQQTRGLAHLLSSKSERTGSKARLADPMVIACLIVAYKKNPNRTNVVIEALTNNIVGAVGTPLHTLNEVLTEYDNKKKLVRNPPDLPLSKKILVCLFYYMQDQQVLSMKELNDIISKDTKRAEALRKVCINYFKTELPPNHPSGMTHSFIPSAASSWRDDATSTET